MHPAHAGRFRPSHGDRVRARTEQAAPRLSPCFPPSSQQKGRRGMSFHGGETRPAPGAPAPGQWFWGRRPHAQRPLPLPLVHIQGQGKTIASSARLSNHRELWVRPDSAESKTGFKYGGHRPAGRAAGSPTKLTVSVTLRSLLLDLCTRPNCLPGPSPAAGEGRDGGRPRSPGGPPATAAGTGPVLLSPKGADRLSSM